VRASEYELVCPGYTDTFEVPLKECRCLGAVQGAALDRLFQAGTPDTGYGTAVAEFANEIPDEGAPCRRRSGHKGNALRNGALACRLESGNGADKGNRGNVRLVSEEDEPFMGKLAAEMLEDTQTPDTRIEHADRIGWSRGTGMLDGMAHRLL
jgi:hypothetical protein